VSARRWLPRSLYGRNLLLIVGLILCAEIGAALAFHVLIQMPRIERLGELSEKYLGVLSTAVAHMPPGERERFSQQLQQQDGTVLISRQAPTNLVRPNALLTRLALERLQRRLDERAALAWSEQPRPRLWVASQIGDETWWLGLDAGALGGARLALAFGILLATTLLAALGAGLIQRNIHRPLKTLEQAAAGLADGQFPVVHLADAPSEIAHLATAFDSMARRLEAGERERGIMLAGISHDLRTPLAKLRLAVEILHANGEEELLQGMVRNIAAADQIIDQFIDFARLGNEEAATVCDAEELLRDIVATFATPRLVIAPVAADLPLLPCRPVALRRAIANLLGNALKYSSEEVTIRLESRGENLHFYIVDRGPGIPEAELPRLRQPFTRLAQARGGPAGAGLGLAIVERIMAQAGGRLALRNLPNGGLEAELILSGLDLEPATIDLD
jgi:two-component system osmolarity sensor histidine kinase EnvZ